jgi:hypothetical protein
VIAVQPFDFSEMLATTGRGRISGVAIKGVDPALVTQVLDLKQHMVEGDLELTSLAAIPDVDHPPNIIIGKELARKLKSKVLGVNAHVIVMKNSQDFAEYRDVMATARAIGSSWPTSCGSRSATTSRSSRRCRTSTSRPGARRRRRRGPGGSGSRASSTAGSTSTTAGSCTPAWPRPRP